MLPVSCTNTLQDVPDFANHGMVFENGILRMEFRFSAKLKNFKPVPQITYFEIFSFVADVTFNSFDQF